MELLVAAGLTPVQALTAATSAAADAFGLKDRGRIAVGARADLVLVGGDPAFDIKATRSIVAVWKAGRRFDRAAFTSRNASQRQTAVSAASKAPSLPVLLSDFEEGKPATAFGSGWVVTTDAMMGGKSTAQLAVVSGGAESSAAALQISGEVVAGTEFAWSGAIFFPGNPPMTPVDLSAAGGFSVAAQGDGATYRVMAFLRRAGQAPVTRTFEADVEWETHHFRWSDFMGGDGSDVLGIAIVAGPQAGPYRLRIDRFNIR